MAASPLTRHTVESARIMQGSCALTIGPRHALIAVGVGGAADPELVVCQLDTGDVVGCESRHGIDSVRAWTMRRYGDLQNR